MIVFNFRVKGLKSCFPSKFLILKLYLAVCWNNTATFWTNYGEPERSTPKTWIEKWFT